MKKIINCLFALLVLEAFKDKNDHAIVYQPGDHLETDDLSRVNDLVKRGLAEIESVGVAEDAAGDGANGGNAGGSNTGGEAKPTKVVFDGNEYEPQVIKDALIAIGVPVAPNAGVNGLTKKIGEITEEQTAALKEKLIVTE